jgi:hypothetical protein
MGALCCRTCGGPGKRSESQNFWPDIAASGRTCPECGVYYTVQEALVKWQSLPTTKTLPESKTKRKDTK